MVSFNRQNENNPVQRHVVLIAPEVHWNTGNIGRTCLGVGAELHLVRPLGFSLDDRHVKRAGLDYWSKVKLSVWDHQDHFFSTLDPKPEEIALFSKNGTIPHWSMPCSKRMFLIFGSETKGLPESLLKRYQDRLYCIPISSSIRCLNLSTCAGIALYESLRSNCLLVNL
ncbi:MAG: tRNA (cytidine(34)-2'-O)-methyltransferase [Desulfobacteraceae bacterium]|nr:tRNA (cytidine(34)-2'-O)-methyltransferase [Desulfobacteraceae bacterium]